jgi:rubrerythrin
MANVFSAAEIIDMGIVKEKKRRDFYGYAADKFKEKDMKDLFSKLRDWEDEQDHRGITSSINDKRRAEKIRPAIFFVFWSICYHLSVSSTKGGYCMSKGLKIILWI